ncbi:MAG: GNAT family N-acetyltransferase [Phycisphaerae bacterium]|nr:GNAT family N-acetyltransferase [Phycisphaerae bacterium]
MSKLGVELRPATAADLNDLIELLLGEMPAGANAANLAAAEQLDRLDRQERGEVEFLVAERKGKIVGQIVLRWPGKPDRWGRTDRQPLADVEDLRVTPAHRGRGVGAEMLDHVEWLCMREDIDRVVLAVDPSTDADIVAWLQRRDYVPVGDAYEVPRDGSGEGEGSTSAEPSRRVDLVKDLW